MIKTKSPVCCWLILLLYNCGWIFFLPNIFPKIMNCLQLIHISRYIDFDILNNIENARKKFKNILEKKLSTADDYFLTARLNTLDKV